MTRTDRYASSLITAALLSVFPLAVVGFLAHSF